MSLAEVVSIPAVVPHKNADNLEIVPLKEGDTYRQYITAKGQFHPGDKGILIKPGAIVPPADPFKWLWPEVDGVSFWYIPYKSRKIKARRLRGEWSSGLLMAPSELGLDVTDIIEGTDLADLIGVHEESAYGEDTIGSISYPKPRCTRKHMPRSLRGWVRYIRYRVIG